MLQTYFFRIPRTVGDQISACMDRANQTGSQAACVFRLEYTANQQQDMLRVISQAENMSAFFIGVAGKTQEDIDQAIALGEACKKSNRDHYIVYVLPSVTLLMDMVPHMISISGLLAPPFEEKDVMKTVERIRDDYRLLHLMDGNAPSSFVALRYLGSIIRLRPNEIQYVEAQDKKLQIHRQDKSLAIYDNMKQMQGRLGNRFFHCHRSYLVNCDAIRRIDLPRMEIELFDGTIIPISRTYREEARQLLEQMQQAESAC